MEIENSENNKSNTIRKKAQHVNFEALQQLMMQNVSKTNSKSYVQYTKDNIISYLQSPANNIDNIREVSRFLTRYSMIYKKLIMYYATLPFYYYHVDPIFDLNKGLDFNKVSKNYYTVLERLNQIDMAKEMTTIVSTALRDGVFYGYIYDSDGKDGFWIHGLDPRYCKIAGKTSEGQLVFKFNAAYFDSGNNKEFVLGVDGDTSSLWADCFIQGYNDYKNLGRDYQWFVVTIEKSFCLLAGNDDEFDVPLPYFVSLFISLLDLLDLESLLTQRTALENYVLLISKIPLISGSDDVDDFAVSLDLVQNMQQLIDSAVPDLVGTAYAPFDVEAINFNQSNSTEKTDMLANSIANLYNNAGASQLVVSGGASTNSVGLKHALENDQSNEWLWTNRLESALNAYIKWNISDNMKFSFHKITWYNEDEYIAKLQGSATLGDSVLPYLSALHGNDYKALCSIQFENQLGIKSIMTPLASSYTSNTTTDEGGRPSKDPDDLSSSGIDTKDNDKNGTEST